MSDAAFYRAFHEAFTVVDQSQSEQDGVVMSSATSSVSRAFPQLNAEEGRILALRVGLDCGEPRSVSEVARVTGLRVRVVRHLERQALSKLRHPSTAA